MNATMQQLFMIPSIRSAVLQHPLRRTREPSGSNGSVVYQLQRMFAYLQDSERASYNPLPLTRALHQPDGTAVDVQVQQDASE